MATPLTRAEWLDECAKLAKTYEEAMTDEAKARCSICKRPLDSPSDPTSLDCGGDCLRCMALIAEDPDCMTSYIETQAREIERLRETLRAVFEEWAGSEGFIPETAPEGYLLQLTKRMADIARAALGEKQ